MRTVFFHTEPLGDVQGLLSQPAADARFAN